MKIILPLISKATRFLLVLYSVSSYAAAIVENKGQISQQISDKEHILFYTSIDGGYAYFLEDRIAFVLTRTTDKSFYNNVCTGSKKNVFRYDLKIKSNNKLSIETDVSSEEKINFYKNEKHFSVHQYNKIIYRNIGDGVSLVFYNHPGKGLKYDIVFDDPKKTEAEFTFELIGTTAKTDNQTISFYTPLGEVIEKLPLVYADILKNNKFKRIPQTCDITIDKNLLTYSAKIPLNCNSLIIDPWASFAGGNDVDECFGVDGDINGNIYISGYTVSPDFPSSPGAFQTGLNADYDSFIFKFDPTGQRIWATYYGGSQNDFGYRLKVSPSGKPTISGYTYSNDMFVSPSGVFSSVFSGLVDAFITQFDSNGNFKWGTYLGGTGGDFAIGMDMDKTGNIALAGFTSSSDFPVSPGAWQSAFGGGLDCFVAKFDSTGNRTWNTFMGGINSEDAHTVKYDSYGNVIIAGDTYSSNFPVSSGAYQNFPMGGGECYVAKFNSGGINTWSTYLGGSGDEDIEALSCDAHNNIYFTGYSNSNDLPISAGAFQTTMNGIRDLTVGSFTPGGNLRWLIYAGGSTWDMGRGIIVNTNSKITVCGETNSTDFPIVGNDFQTTNAGSSDIVYMTLDSLGTVELSNLKGGTNADYSHDICEVTQEKIAISGSTYSTDFPVTPGVFQTTENGDVEAFLWEIDSTLATGTTPIKDINNGVYIYPNPANEKIIITGLKKGDYKLIVYDNLGKEIRNEQFISSGDISLNNLNLTSGVYSIVLISSEKTQIFKLVKT